MNELVLLNSSTCDYLTNAVIPRRGCVVIPWLVLTEAIETCVSRHPATRGQPLSVFPAHTVRITDAGVEA